MKMHESEGDLLVKELRTIKLLLVLQLLNQGLKQKQIASALGVSEATMSRMIPRESASRKGKRGGTPDADASN